uniref:General transcription factor IIH subunit n=1 Tax=Strigamia maritima TaxID=126957 RepID=T1JJK0_STRMM
MAEEDNLKEYQWETGYEKTWEAIREDADGHIESSIEDILQRARKRRFKEKAENVRLGMMRHLYVIVDLSESMQDQDLKPTRQICTLKLLECFVEEYFDQNPISQIGIIATRNKRAEKITELGGNPKRHVNALKKAADLACTGEPSLQNSLQMAVQTLRHLPSHVSREVVIIFGSLTTCDPGNIFTVIDLLKQTNVRCSVIGLSAELRICKYICQETKGIYGVILDETHYKELLYQHLSPPPALMNAESSLIRMGFPHHLAGGDTDAKPSMCMCHLDSKNSGQGFSTSGYFCPQCRSKYCELPVECKACGLTLVSAPHLARSYHHLFPLDVFDEMNTADETCCSACEKRLASGEKGFECKLCSGIFCMDCDAYIHETLHVCPSCASSSKLFQQM